MTTEPAPIIANSPMVMPQMMVEFAQMLAPCFTIVFLNLSVQSPWALGNISLVVITFGPMNTLSSMVSPS